MNKGLMQQDLFSLEELDEINRKYQEQLLEQKIKEAYKTMNLLHFENPSCDNELLLNYQYEYITTGSKKAWDEMFLLSYRVVERIINSEIKKKGLYVKDREDKVLCGVEYVLRRYKKNVGWYVHNSFISALKNGAKHALKYTTKIERETVYFEEIKNAESKSYKSLYVTD